MNVVHTENDTCERKLENSRANFNRWERENFGALLTDYDLADAYRESHPTEKAATYYGAWRHLQIGNRIDYFLISRLFMSHMTRSEIRSDFGSGQSVPISLEFTF